MCGRFALRYPTPRALQRFGVREVPEIPPRYNIAPTQEVLIVRPTAQGSREFAFCRWGLIPHWAEDPAIGNKMINARSETVFDKPAFRNAARSRRCLIPADAFYEWKRLPHGKQPFAFTLADTGLFAFAGLWETWKPNHSDEAVVSCTILTREASRDVSPIHQRMPVIIAPQRYDEWLDASQHDPKRLLSLLNDTPPPLSTVPVSPRINNPANEDPSVLEPVRPDLLSL